MKQINLHDLFVVSEGGELKRSDDVPFDPPFELLGEDGQVIGVVCDPESIKDLMYSPSLREARQTVAILMRKRVTKQAQRNLAQEEVDRIEAARIARLEAKKGDQKTDEPPKGRSSRQKEK